MNLMSLMSVPRLPVYTAWLTRLFPPSEPPPANPAPRYVRPPSFHAWGGHGDVHGVVQRDAAGVCTSVVAVNREGNRETFEVEAMPAAVAREWAVRLIQQADAWDCEFGGGVRP